MYVNGYTKAEEHYKDMHTATHTHTTSHLHPAVKVRPAHTLGVNVKASTPWGTDEPQIHLSPDSCLPLATHTHLAAEHTLALFQSCIISPRTHTNGLTRPCIHTLSYTTE